MMREMGSYVLVVGVVCIIQCKMEPVPVLKALCRYFRFSCGYDACCRIHNIVIRVMRAHAPVTGCSRPFGHRGSYFWGFDMMSSS